MEEEVASYVLAYLLKGNYPNTAGAFLQECSALPKSLMVLPQTPLPEIIATYKAWSDANVLKYALGPVASLNALWSKLDQTLIQIKKLSEEAMLAEQPKSTAFHTHGQPFSTNASTAKSPRRKRPHPQRNARTIVETAAPSKNNPHSEPEITHILDSFLNDTALTERLADIINKCVERPGGEVELSSSTLDHILDITCTEPAFEGVLKTAESTPVVSVATSDEDLLEPPLKQQRGEQSTHVFPCSMDLDSLEPPLKQQRGEQSTHVFPCSMDLDSFLDKVHAAVN